MFCACKSVMKGSDHQRLQLLAQQRESLQPDCGGRFRRLTLQGKYTEFGDTLPCQYELQFQPSGEFHGQGRDDDGVAQVLGKIRWPQGSPTGDVKWKETRPGSEIETTGTLRSIGRDQSG